MVLVILFTPISSAIIPFLFHTFICHDHCWSFLFFHHFSSLSLLCSLNPLFRLRAILCSVLICLTASSL
uniref:Putative secreted protein n=1 Tax=Lutzomyia longipalpis TaxID=7200 RepID=A0A7G3AH33_LUTLO